MNLPDLFWRLLPLFHTAAPTVLTVDLNIPKHSLCLADDVEIKLTAAILSLHKLTGHYAAAVPDQHQRLILIFICILLCS